MSEYQYYEFQAIDRLLTHDEVAAVASISSRATVSAGTAVFTYSYKDFPGGAARVLAAYFDAHLCLSDWGDRRLMFRLPIQAVDRAALRAYSTQGLIDIQATDNYLLLDFHPDIEDHPDWVDPVGMLSTLVSLRADLMAGDLRACYLVWLLGCSADLYKADEMEPPVPDGLADLGPSHEALITFFGVDRDWVAAAAEGSRRLMPVAEWNPATQLAQLSMAEKDDFLLRLARGEPGLQAALRRRLQSLAGPPHVLHSQPQRTVATLRRAAEDHRAQRNASRGRQAQIDSTSAPRIDHA